MIIQHTYKGIDYILSNENLQEGDRVYPISRGRTCESLTLKKAYHIHYNYDFRDFMSGFPDEPHRIQSLCHSDDKAYEIRTDHGYGPVEMYYKILVSMNKSDYLVDRIVPHKRKHTYLRVFDKISHSVIIAIGPRSIKIHSRLAQLFTDKDWEILKAFRTKELIVPKFHRGEYELTDVLNEKI